MFVCIYFVRVVSNFLISFQCSAGPVFGSNVLRFINRVKISALLPRPCLSVERPFVVFVESDRVAFIVRTDSRFLWRGRLTCASTHGVGSSLRSMQIPGFALPRPIWCYAAPPASPQHHCWHARGASPFGFRPSVGMDEVTFAITADTTTTATTDTGRGRRTWRRRRCSFHHHHRRRRRRMG